MRRLLPLVALLLLVGGSGTVAAGSHSRQIRLVKLAHVEPGGGYSADVFGHKGYAYLSSWHGNACPAQGVRVYDLRDPRRPRRVSTFADAASHPAVKGSWTEKTIVRHVQTPALRGELAVTSFQACRSGGFQGFGLYDVSNPARPRELALVRLEPRGSHEIWLQPKGRHAYVYTAILRSELLSAPDYDPKTNQARTPGKPDLRIFDVTDPPNPVEVGDWGAWKALGIYPNDGRGQVKQNFVHSVITNPTATRAYLSYWDLGTVILDVSNPAKPRYLGRTPPVDPEGDAHSATLADGGSLLIETHERAGGRPILFDISNPRRPRKLAVVRSPGPVGASLLTGVHDPKARDHRAFFSWYRYGVVVADISRPSRPRVIAHFVPPPSTDPDGVLCGESRCSLVWGVYPEKRYVLASDMVGGLWVLRLRE